MAISRNQLVKELEPGLNALFGLEYKQYENQSAEIYTTESSDRAFEEEVMMSGFASAQVKPEGSGVSYDNAQETFTARYTNETIALAFAITEEAIEDNLYDRLASRYTKALARSMAQTKQVKAASPESKLSVVGNPWFKGTTAFTCLVFAIDLANAFVYLEASLSYRLSSIASSVIAKARAIVSLVYLAVKVS